jgi:hypothetical protein
VSLDTEYASASASVREATPSTSDPESQFIRLDGTTSAKMRGLLDVEHGVPPGQDATVLSATLYLYKAESWSGTATVTVEPLSASWDPYSSTWTNQPGVRAASATVSVDITSLIASAVAADDAAASRWYGVRLSITASGQRLFYSPLGPEEYRPKLVRDYSVPPDAPSDPIPNGQVVSETKPLLVATFTDQDADDTISAIEVEIDDSSAFGSLHYDSGKVSHTEASFDTNSPPTGAPVMTALTAATTYYWRMRVWDNHDQVSDWSPTAEFTIVAKGALVLTAPAGSTVSTATPTITHTFSGTQDEIEVEIERLEDGVWLTHWELPRHVSTALSHTVPDGYALEEGETYRVAVRVWDDESRADLPGDLSYAEDTQEFTVSAST